MKDIKKGERKMKKIEEVLVEIKMRDDFNNYVNDILSYRNIIERCKTVAVIRYLEEVHGIKAYSINGLSWGGVDIDFHGLHDGMHVRMDNFQNIYQNIRCIIQEYLDCNYGINVDPGIIKIDKNLVCRYILEEFKDNVLEDTSYVITFKDISDVEERIKEGILGIVLPRHNIRLR